MRLFSKGLFRSKSQIKKTVRRVLNPRRFLNRSTIDLNKGTANTDESSAVALAVMFYISAPSGGERNVTSTEVSLLCFRSRHHVRALQKRKQREEKATWSEELAVPSFRSMRSTLYPVKKFICEPMFLIGVLDLNRP